MAEKMSLNKMMLEWALQLVRSVGDAAKVVVDGNKLIISADFDGVTPSTPLKPPLTTTVAPEPGSGSRSFKKQKKQQTPSKEPATTRAGRASREEKIVEYLQAQGNKGAAIMKLASVAGIGKDQKRRIVTAAILRPLVKAGTVFKLGSKYRHADFPRTNRGAKPGTKRKTKTTSNSYGPPTAKKTAKKSSSVAPNRAGSRKKAGAAATKPKTPVKAKPAPKRASKASSKKRKRVTGKAAKSTSERTDTDAQASGGETRREPSEASGE